MTEFTLWQRILLWGWTLSLFLLITYVICVGFGLFAPDTYQMHQAWGKYLPGFEWLTWPGFLAGAAWVIFYGWFTAFLVVPLHSFISRKLSRPQSDGQHKCCGQQEE